MGRFVSIPSVETPPVTGTTGFLQSKFTSAVLLSQSGLASLCLAADGPVGAGCHKGSDCHRYSVSKGPALLLAMLRAGGQPTRSELPAGMQSEGEAFA